MYSITNVEVPLIISKIENHKELKPLILNAIEEMGEFSFKLKNKQSISNTDWFLPSNFERKYFNLVKDVFEKVILNLSENHKFVGHELTIGNYWFQQYKEKDFHKWHIHVESYYNSVYYVDLPEKSARTCFNFFGKEIVVDVEEGDVLSFPGSFIHCSKPNQSKETKTIISFNTQLKINNGI